MEYTIKDSGARQEFATGARRDERKGKGRYDLIPHEPLRRLAIQYELGAEKYGDDNWQKGMPMSRMFDSALRHLWNWRMRQFEGIPCDEDELAAVLFNVMAMMHYELYNPELNDMGVSSQD